MIARFTYQHRLGTVVTHIYLFALAVSISAFLLLVSVCIIQIPMGLLHRVLLVVSANGVIVTLGASIAFVARDFVIVGDAGFGRR